MVVIMNVLIINLPRSKDRREFQEKQFKDLNIKPIILNAVSTDDISEHQFEKEAFGWQRPLKKVELACFLSHKKAWEYVINYNKPMLIIEDDAVVVRDLKILLQELELNTKSFHPDLINLEVRSRKKIIGKEPVCEFEDLQYKLLPLYQERTGTGGYILFPTGAKKLLEKSKNIPAATADAFIFSTYELNTYQIEPAALVQEDQMIAYGLANKESFESTIGRSEHFKPEFNSINEKIKFKKRRLVGQIAMAIRYLQVMGKAEKRLINLDQKRFIQD